jgi:uncharacterized protein YwqG
MTGPWARYKGRPLCCVAQLDLADIRSAGGPDWLPPDGRLLFFYELEAATWGLYTEDLGSFAVIHQTGPRVAAVQPDDLPDEARFPAYPVGFEQAHSYPSEERLKVDWSRLNKASSKALEDALDALAPPSPAHQIGGYPSPVQGDDMEAECERVSPRGRERGGVGDWRLLLQLDTDNDAGMMWGDVGSLYFWIREHHARAGDFSKVWLILQCH